MLIVSGSAAHDIGHDLGAILKFRHIKSALKVFGNDEILVQLDCDFAEPDVLIVQRVSGSVNSNLMELFFIAERLKALPPRTITVFIPYFAYSRQVDQGGARSAILRTLKSFGVSRVLTLDLHSRQDQDEENGLFSINSMNLFLPLLDLGRKDDVVFIFPDKGSFERACRFVPVLNFVSATKTRLPDGSCLVKIDGEMEVRDKKCIIVDDLVDSANTLFAAAELLKEKGAIEVSAFVTHGILSQGAVSLIDRSFIKRLYIANSVELKNTSPKIAVIPIARLVADFIVANFC